MIRVNGQPIQWGRQPKPAPKAVTKPVTKVPSVTKATGRPKVHATAAERQRAYRARRKAT